MSDRFQALTVFRRVARSGSFSRAGRELGLSQSSVSRILSELEVELGVTLLSRTTRAVTLTDAGADYLTRSEAILDAMEEADHMARGGGALRGTLRIGLSTSFGLREIVPRLPEFLAVHPGLNVDLVVSDFHQDLVREGIDVAFRLGAMTDSTMVSRQLAVCPRVLAAAPKYLSEMPDVEKPEDLATHAFIVGPGLVLQTLDFRQSGRRVPVKVTGRVTCAINEGATAAATAGLGITMSSLWAVTRELEDGRLVRVLSEWTLPPVTLSAVFPPGRSTSPAARSFALFIGGKLTSDKTKA